MKVLTDSLPKILLVLAILGTTAYLTVDGVLTSVMALGVLSLIVGATAVAGTIVLSGPQPNTDLVPHLVILLAIIGFVTALGAKGYFDGSDIVAIFGVLIGGGSVGLGSVNPTPAGIAKFFSPPPPPPPSRTDPTTK